MAHALFRYSPIAQALASLPQPHAEVIRHDLGTHSIFHISTPVSNRKPGDKSLPKIDDHNLDPENSMTGP